MAALATAAPPRHAAPRLVSWLVQGKTGLGIGPLESITYGLKRPHAPFIHTHPLRNSPSEGVGAAANLFYRE